jgi:hypothetical protein
MNKLRKKSLKGDRETAPGKAEGDLKLKMTYKYYFYSLPEPA